jgi:hypothetical protein
MQMSADLVAHEPLKIILTPKEEREIGKRGFVDLIYQYEHSDAYSRPSLEWMLGKILVGMGLRSPLTLYAEDRT